LNGQLAMHFESLEDFQSLGDFEECGAFEDGGPFETNEAVDPCEPLTTSQTPQPLRSLQSLEPSQPLEPITHSRVPKSDDDELAGDVAGALVEKSEPLAVRIVRSARRKKTVGAQLKDGVVEVTVPKWMSKSEADKFAEQFRKRFEKARASTSVDLAARARRLCRMYKLPKPLGIRWVSNQNSRWGSCTPSDSTIRINNRLSKVPVWVLDYVIVHEVCHLRHPDHSPEFWALVNTYPLTERARGFLLGMGMIEDGDPSTDDVRTAGTDAPHHDLDRD
jgi:predicted metal-dependent hydrolase